MVNRLLTLMSHTATHKKPFSKHLIFIGILNSNNMGLDDFQSDFFHFVVKRCRDRRDGVTDSNNLLNINMLYACLAATLRVCHAVTGVTDCAIRGLLFCVREVFAAYKRARAGAVSEVFTAYKKEKGLTPRTVKPYPCRSSAQSEDGVRNPDNTKPHQHRPQTVLFLCKSVCSLWRIVWGSPWAGRFPWFPVLRTPYNLPPLNRFVTVGGSFLNYQGACHYA